MIERIEEVIGIGDVKAVKDKEKGEGVSRVITVRRRGILPVIVKTNGKRENMAEVVAAVAEDMIEALQKTETTTVMAMPSIEVEAETEVGSSHPSGTTRTTEDAVAVAAEAVSLLGNANATLDATRAMIGAGSRASRPHSNETSPPDSAQTPETCNTAHQEVLPMRETRIEVERSEVVAAATVEAEACHRTK